MTTNFEGFVSELTTYPNLMKVNTKGDRIHNCLLLKSLWNITKETILKLYDITCEKEEQEEEEKEILDGMNESKIIEFINFVKKERIKLIFL